MISIDSPSLSRLIDALPLANRLRLSAEALAIVCQQIEQIVAEDNLAASISIGMLRFSIFRLHQERVARLAPFCRSITVYGEADTGLRHIPGIRLVALPREHRLCQEWFMVVDSPGFWAALLTYVAAGGDGTGSGRYQFVGALSSNPQIVDRAGLLLSLEHKQLPTIDHRDKLVQRSRWARVAYSLATHPQAGRLGLAQAVSELPELLELLSSRGLSSEHLLPQALQSLQRHSPATGMALYRVTSRGGLGPAAWSGQVMPPPPEPGGVVPRVLSGGVALVEPLADAALGMVLGKQARSLVAAPVLVRGRPWGVLCAGQAEPDPELSPVAPVAVGVATLLGLLLGE